MDFGKFKVTYGPRSWLRKRTKGQVRWSTRSDPPPCCCPPSSVVLLCCIRAAFRLFDSDDRMARQSRCRSRTPVPPPDGGEQPGIVEAFSDPAGTQLGGGRRQPSQPPSVETPTRLRTRIKPTGRDTGVIQNAGRRSTNV
ncbi:hypothetical protein L210DRAFT_3184738 [Boletus edulis BED1]|uniref:Uncharacterized protein n=1 Tax=Boletus edulis BED1 TaxID=1328754 RepID=A0AAD4BGE1_BOLED|nr:hypothetical protein L210DRAFT_3184738 [Boletus edulis BED1]